MPKRNDVVNVHVIKVNIPRRLLCRCFYSCGPLDLKTRRRMVKKLAEIEAAMHKLMNVRSVVERLAEKAF